MSGRWRALVAASVVTAASIAGGTAVLETTTGGDEPAARASVATAAPADPRPVAPTGPGEEAELLEVQQDSGAEAPVRVEVPSLGIDSRLDRLGTDARGRLDAPPEWDVAGWFDDGPRPGEVGPAVIAGHLDSPTGAAVFARLSELAPGDVVRVTDAGGTVREFAVTDSTTTPQDGFPTEAVYGPTPDPQLRLITCDGAYDAAAGGYQDNLLVFATEVVA